MNIPDGFKLVPVELLERCVQAIVNTSQMHPTLGDLREFIAAPTPPQPIYDEANELEKFYAHWKLEGRIYRDKNTKQWLPTRDSIEGFQMAERVHALWLGWEACAQSRAKSVEVGDE